MIQLDDQSHLDKKIFDDSFSYLKNNAWGLGPSPACGLYLAYENQSEGK